MKIYIIISISGHCYNWIIGNIFITTWANSIEVLLSDRTYEYICKIYIYDLIIHIILSNKWNISSKYERYETLISLTFNF